MYELFAHLSNSRTINERTRREYLGAGRIIEINPEERGSLERSRGRESGRVFSRSFTSIGYTRNDTVHGFVRVSRIKQGRLLLAVCFCDLFLLHSGTRRSAFRRGRNFYFIITAVCTTEFGAHVPGRERERGRKKKRRKRVKREGKRDHQKRLSSFASRTFSLV